MWKKWSCKLPPAVIAAMEKHCGDDALIKNWTVAAAIQSCLRYGDRERARVIVDFEPCDLDLDKNGRRAELSDSSEAGSPCVVARIARGQIVKQA